jgi:hypothetical protein
LIFWTLQANTSRFSSCWCQALKNIAKGNQERSQFTHDPSKQPVVGSFFLSINETSRKKKHPSGMGNMEAPE